MRAQLSSNLLLAVPQLAFGSFNCLTQRPISGNNGQGIEDHIHVIALDCKTAEEIPTCLERLLGELEDALKKTEDEKTIANVKNSQNFITNRLNEIKAGGYKHDVPQYLKDIINRDLWKYQIKEEQMLYLSGVSYIEN